MMSKLVALLVAALFVAGICLAADKKAPSDDLISDHVRLKLSADPDVKGGALDATCKIGVCTITGTVETMRQKDKATKLAKKVKGVKQVVNNLVVKEKTGAK
jgi:hyperosmotically inducible periplasmic protein